MLPGLATRPTSVAPPPSSLSLSALGMFSQSSGFMWPCAVAVLSTSFSDDPLRWVFLDDGRTLADPPGDEGLSLPCIASSSFFNLQIEIKGKFNPTVWHILYYRPQTKLAKVMFSKVSVCPRRGCLPLVQGGRGCGRHPPGQTPPSGRHPPGQTHPWGRHPLGRHPPMHSACWDTVY